MGENKILYSQHDDVHFLRFRGNILHTLAPALDGFLKHLSQTPNSHSYLLDLTETRSIDSTMLGLLARIAKLAREQHAPTPTLVCPNEDIIDLLVGIGFDEVFSLTAGDGNLFVDGQEVPRAQMDSQALARTMLEAHQELIALKEENHLLFEDLIELLRRSMDQPQA
jgi:anti-anti-sigma factor